MWKYRRAINPNRMRYQGLIRTSYHSYLFPHPTPLIPHLLPHPTPLSLIWFGASRLPESTIRIREPPVRVLSKSQTSRTGASWPEGVRTGSGAERGRIAMDDASGWDLRIAPSSALLCFLTSSGVRGMPCQPPLVLSSSRQLPTTEYTESAILVTKWYTQLFPTLITHTNTQKQMQTHRNQQTILVV